MTAFTLAPFAPRYTEAVFRIAADTAFFGEPVEHFLEDRNLFCDAYYRYYTRFEVRHSWVALGAGDVVGFLMGCRETRLQAGRWARAILPLVLAKTLRGGYHWGPLTRRYLSGLIRAYFAGEMPHADVSRYPAHLHLNVVAPWRGLGIGRRLLQTYLDQLRQEGVPGVHLCTTDQNQAACHLYAACGFQRLDARTTRLWAYWRAAPVENRCYGLRLSR